MSINMRSVAEATLQPGQIQEIHFSDACVSERVLQNDIVGTDTVKANAITLAKAADDVRMHQFVGEETEVSATGTTWVDAKTARFVKHPFNPSEQLRLIASLKTNDALKTAHLGLFIDDVEELDLTSVDTNYEMVSGVVDISALATGRHEIVIKLKSEDAAGESWNDMIDVMFVK